MKLPLPAVVVIACLQLFACQKKEKPVTYTGRLLFTRKNPAPVANRIVEVYQPGNGAAIGIPSGSTAAQASTQTDASGTFQLVFTPGTTTFIIFSGTNSNPLTLSGSFGDSSFMQFSRSNFPDSAYEASKPIFIGKTIDMAVISAQLLSALAATDTIGLAATTVAGYINKEYTGRTGAAGSVIVLDTIYNLLFTDFDCRQKTFANTLRAGWKHKYPYGNFSISSEGSPLPIAFPAADETKQEIKFYFKKY